MSEKVLKNILGKQISAAVADDAENTLVTDYLPMVNIVKQAEEDFYNKMEKFFSLTLADPGLEKAAKAWEKAGALLMGYAESLFKMDKADREIREYALELMDKASKAANIRLNNITRYCEKKISADPNNTTTADKMDQLKYHAYVDVLRSVNTWRRFRDAYVNGEEFTNAQLQEEAEDAIEYHKELALLPKDHISIPGRIYPPIPIPAGEPVPQPPLAYQLEKEAPAEAKEYDPELDELVIKKGWVDPNGMIDDRSVIRDREHGVVIMKLIGGEPEVWKEWKATWTGDVMEDGSWEQEYYLRLGRQMKEHSELQLFIPQRYEEAVKKRE